MANIKSAIKRNRTNEIGRGRNRSYRTRMRTAIKELRTAIDAGDRATAESLLPGTLELVDKTAQKKIIHDNAAARTKSRLSRAVAKLAG